MAPGKSETYSVEGGNADLRHYLARLGRQSRCFSRCFEALRRAVFVFVHCYNERPAPGSGRTRSTRRRSLTSCPYSFSHSLFLAVVYTHTDNGKKVKCFSTIACASASG